MCDACGKPYKDQGELWNSNFERHLNLPIFLTFPVTLNGHILREHGEEHVDPSVKIKKRIPTWRKALGGKVSNNEKAPCPICGKILTVRKALSNHLLMVHTYEHGVHCFVCARRFNRYGSLVIHLRENHASKGQIPADVPLPKRQQISTVSPATGKRYKRKPVCFTCKYCQLTFTNQLRQFKHYFKTHPKEHLEKTPFYCTHCFKAYGTEGELQKHQMTSHDHLKCKECGKQFMRTGIHQLICLQF